MFIAALVLCANPYYILPFTILGTGISGLTLKLQPGILLLIAGAWLPGTVIIKEKKQNWNTAEDGSGMTAISWKSVRENI